MKESTRNLGRGKAAKLKYRIEGSTKIKGTLKEFLAHNKTKSDFVTYLAEEAKKAFQDTSSHTPFQYLVSADGKTQGNIESHNLNNHEEADTLMVLHAIEATRSQPKNHRIVVFSPDTDVFIILYTFHEQLSATTYMRQTTEKLICIKKIADRIGSRKSKALSGFHAFTECDTTGKFTEKGKLSWWKHFAKADNNVIEAFVSLGASHEIYGAVLDQLEMVTCNVYCPAIKGN